MSREKKQAIGEVECPRKGCDLKAQVFKYRTQAKADTAIRFAGRLYCVCEKGHRCDDDEYVRSNAHLWSPGENVTDKDASNASAVPSKKQVPQASATRAATQQQQQAPKKKPASWGFW